MSMAPSGIELLNELPSEKNPGQLLDELPSEKHLGHAMRPGEDINPADIPAGPPQPLPSGVNPQQLIQNAGQQQEQQVQAHAPGGMTGFMNAVGKGAVGGTSDLFSRIRNHFDAGVRGNDLVSMDPNAPTVDPTYQQAEAQTRQDVAAHHEFLNRALPTNPDLMSTKVGNIVGQAVPLVTATAVDPALAIPAAVGLGAENRIQSVEGNPNLSRGQKAAYVGGGMIWDAILGRFIPAGPVAGGAGRGILSAIGRTAGQVGIGTAEGAGYALGENALAKVTGVDPDRPWLQGLPEQATTMGIVRGATHVAGEAHAPTAANEAGPVAGPEETRSAEVPKPEETKPAAVSPDAERVAEVEKRMAAVDLSKLPDRPAEVKEETPKELGEGGHTFQTPEEAGATPTPELDQRLNEHEFQPRRQEENPVPPDAEGERRFEELAKGATFETPEEAAKNPGKPVEEPYKWDHPEFPPNSAAAAEPGGTYKWDHPEFPPNPLASAREGVEQTRAAEAAKPNVLEQAAGNHAAIEEYGKPAEPATPKEETFFERLKREGAEKAAALAKGEEGGITSEAAGKAFYERDVVPAVHKSVTAVGDVLKAADRQLGLGFTHSNTGEQVRASIRRASGDAIMAGHAFEAALVKTGVRDNPDHSFSKNEASALDAWDAMERGSYIPSASESDAMALLKAKRQENAERTKKLGMSKFDAEGEGYSRVFKPDPKLPADKRPGGGGLLGAEDFLKHQTYENPSDAFKAAKARGLIPAYDNIWDMQLARQYAVEESLNQRENVREHDRSGLLQWNPEHTAPDVGFDHKVEGKIGTETRRLALPTEYAARFAGLEGYQATDFLKENATRGQYIRPGEDPPKGFTYVPVEKVGHFYGPEDTAQAFNEHVPRPIGDAVDQLPRKIATAAILGRYSMSAVHAMWGTASYEANNIGRALAGLTGFRGADLPEGLQAISNMTLIGGLRKGLQIKAHIESGGELYPELAEEARRTMATNPGSHFKSVLDRRPWAEAAEEFRQHNIQGGTLRVIGAVAKSIKDGIYHDLLDNMDLSARRDVAERQMRKGIGENAGEAEVSQAGGTLSRQLGRHVNSPEFKNSVLTATGQLLAPAYALKTGVIRNTFVETLRNNPHAQTMLVGGVILQAISSAATQMLLTKLNTGHAIMPNQLRDYWNPRTGKQNDAGVDERVSIATPLGYILRQFFGGMRQAKDEAVGSLNPAIPATLETIQNKDFYGNQVRPDDASFMGNFFRGLYHIGQGAVPMTINNAQDRGVVDSRTVGDKIGSTLTGIHTNHPGVSDAMQIAEDALGESQTKGRNLKEQAKYAHEQQWAADINAGKRDEAVAEMQKDPSMSRKDVGNVLQRASAKHGLARIVLDTKLTPQHLARMWDAGSSEEQDTMKPGIMRRLHSAQPGSADDRADWKILRDKVLGGTP